MMTKVKKLVLPIIILMISTITLTACNTIRQIPEQEQIINQEFTDKHEPVNNNQQDNNPPRITNQESTNGQEQVDEQGNNENHETTEANEEAIHLIEPSIAWITASNVNLRSQPSTDSEILRILSSKQEVLLQGTVDEWYFISIHNTEDGHSTGESHSIEGFVFAEFVSTDNTFADTEPLTTESPLPETSISETPASESPSLIPSQTPSYGHNPGSLTIAIDAGHQAKGNSAQEPIGPGASTSKAKVTSGTSGVSTKVPEYQLTLDVSLKLRDELIARGYNVVMIRETHDVDISNRERAEIATEAGADIFIRIHADGSENQNVNGILTISPSSKNPFIPHLYEESRRLSENILSAMVERTGARNRGVAEMDNMSGINWATMPVSIIEMGLMTNHAEDELMQTDEYQQKLALGIADGIDLYFYN